MEELELPQEEVKKKKLKLSEVVKATLRHWPWILVSIFLCCGFALWKVLSTQPTYERSASVLIKEKENGGSAGGLGELADLGLVSSSTNIYDEVNKLTSPDLMEEVLARLGLFVSYEEPGTFHDKVLYGANLPVKVTFSDVLPSEAASVEINIDKKGQVTLKDLAVGKQAYDLKGKTFPLGVPIKTGGGQILVEKSPYFREGTEYDILVSREAPKKTVENYLATLAVAVKDRKGNTIDMSIVDNDPLKAEDILATVLDVYNENYIRRTNESTESTSRFIDERLVALQGDLGQVDQNISDFQSQHMIPNLAESAKLNMASNKEASAELLTVASQLQTARHLKALLQSNSAKTQLLPANSGLENKGIETQISEYNKTMVERNQLAANSSDSHPMVEGLDAQLAGMRSAILTSVDNQISALGTVVGNLQGNIAKTTSQIAASPSQAKYLLSVERQQKVKENLYLFLLQKKEENQLSMAAAASNTEVIQKPRGKDRPVAPRKMLTVFFAFIIGAIIPFGVEYVLMANDKKVHTKKDLDSLELPAIGEIPEYVPVKSKIKIKKGEPLVVVKQGKRNVINEAFRVLRTNLEFLFPKTGEGNVLMLTSYNPGSGKTFVAINTGAALALKGKKVVVVDCDMRRAAASEYVDSPSRGLSNYLVGSATDVDSLMVCDTITKDLCVLPVGTIPPNPSELLESPRFPAMIEKLRKEFDYIILDCPPAEMMADAQIINAVSDRAVFIIRAGVMETTQLPELNKLYKANKFKSLSYIFNGVRVANTTYGNGYANSYGLNED